MFDRLKRKLTSRRPNEAQSTTQKYLRRRERFAAEALDGAQCGIEIGALHLPMPVPPGVSVQYVDKLTVAEMKAHYPEIAEKPLVEPDIIADGETLAPVADASQDFVIASHLLEHCENPILAVCNMMRVLKPGGALIIVVPDKRFTFDKDRPVTPLDHFWRDYKNGPKDSRHAHYMEWARLVDKHPDDETAERQTAHYIDIGYSIHFHVFTPANFPALIISIIDNLPLPASLELFCQNGPEMICILRKE